MPHKDICERLREHGYRVSFDAADEIERLREQLERAEAFLARYGVHRTDASEQRVADMLSHAGIGQNIFPILMNISNECYGINSTFDKLTLSNAKICTLGISIYWATHRHYIERMANVPFRFDKTFTGIIRQDKQDRTEQWIYFAAPRISNCQPDGIHLERMAKDHGLISVAKIGRGEIMCINAYQYRQFGMEQLKHEPWLTAKGPPAPEMELLPYL